MNSRARNAWAHNGLRGRLRLCTSILHDVTAANFMTPETKAQAAKVLEELYLLQELANLRVDPDGTTVNLAEQSSLKPED